MEERIAGSLTHLFLHALRVVPGDLPLDSLHLAPKQAVDRARALALPFFVRSLEQ
jgi:hypothetical protein